MGSNQFGGTVPGGFEGRVFAIDKAALYAGSPTLTVVTRSTGFDGTPQPANLHGFNQGSWPTSGPHYIMPEVFDGPTHTVWSWTDPFGANIFNRDGDVDLAAAANSPCPAQSCFPVDVPQQGGFDLQGNDFRGLDTEYRNGFLWTTQTISCNPGGGTVNCVRWAQVDPTGPSVVQAGVFGSPGEWRFFGTTPGFATGRLLVGTTSVYGLRVRLTATSATTGTMVGTLSDGIAPDPDFDVVGTYTITNPPGIGRWQAQIFELGTTNQVGKMAGGFDANPLGTTQGVYKGEWKICN